ncbi:MAG: hypothetical protein IPP71_13730 [Bacteroidetes bacterium]|nr:hypothetical protein [Bacteroidota bacterium]
MILRSHESNKLLKTLEEFYNQELRLYHSTKEKENKDNIVLYQSLSNFFNSYAKHYNKVHERKGTLFTRAFRRKLVTSDTYLQDLIIYLHQNPVKAKLCSQASEWKFSSYNTIIGTEATFVEREEIINLFFDLENFIACNNKPLTDLDSTF